MIITKKFLNFYFITDDDSTEDRTIVLYTITYSYFLQYIHIFTVFFIIEIKVIISETKTKQKKKREFFFYLKNNNSNKNNRKKNKQRFYNLSIYLSIYLFIYIYLSFSLSLINYISLFNAVWSSEPVIYIDESSFIY